jgi:hypothetical protein
MNDDGTAPATAQGRERFLHEQLHRVRAEGRVGEIAKGEGALTRTRIDELYGHGITSLRTVCERRAARGEL